MIESHQPFAISIFRAELASVVDARAAIRDVLVALRETDKGISATQRNAWHSSASLLVDATGPLAILRDAIADFARDALAPFYDQWKQVQPILAEAWAVIGARGAWHVPHHHAPFAWSGVVYVDATEALTGATDPRSGCIEFLSPLPSRTFNVPSGAAYRPRDGVALLFPSALTHFVHPSESDALRICVSFNIDIASR